MEDKESPYAPFLGGSSEALFPGSLQPQDVSGTREEARLRTLVADIAYEDFPAEVPKGRGSQATPSMEWEHSLAAQSACGGRQLVQTTARRIGLAPAEAEIGDKIYLLYGGQVLYILRQAEGRQRLVGECYLHGLMDGEGLAFIGKEGGPQWETIKIS